MNKGSQYDPFEGIIRVVNTIHMMGMGRKSIAGKFYEETSDEKDECNATWLVLYDFKGVKPNPRFWGNLKRLIGLVGEGGLIQYSVFMTKSGRGALTAMKIARHYGAQVMLFKGEAVPFYGN
jgi:hypothetical protein